jgi:hypothetical protein
MNDQYARASIAQFLAKYTPEVAQFAVAARCKLAALFPRGFELVYDNYNALVFGIAPTQRTSDAIVSLAVYPRWVTLFFLKGASLVDPTSLLQGSGSQVRSIRLSSAADLDLPAVRELLAQASQPFASSFADAPALTAVVKSVSAKQRPRKPVAPNPRTKRA